MIVIKRFPNKNITKYTKKHTNFNIDSICLSNKYCVDTKSHNDTILLELFFL